MEYTSGISQMASWLVLIKPRKSISKVAIHLSNDKGQWGSHVGYFGTTKLLKK